MRIRTIWLIYQCAMVRERSMRSSFKLKWVAAHIPKPESGWTFSECLAHEADKWISAILP